MDTIDPTPPQPGTAAPATPADQAPIPFPDRGTDLPTPAYRASTSERVLDLVALLVLIALSAAVFTLAGPGAFTAVTSVGMGLFATWRSHRPPHR
jgi:hypothetical protein